VAIVKINLTAITVTTAPTVSILEIYASFARN
jgi:hypothetical protein